MNYISLMINNNVQKFREVIIIIYHFFVHTAIHVNYLWFRNEVQTLTILPMSKDILWNATLSKVFHYSFLKDVSCKVYSDFAKENICNARMKLTIFPNDVIFSILLQLTKLHPRAGQAQEEFIDLQGFTFRKKAWCL